MGKLIGECVASVQGIKKRLLLIEEGSDGSVYIKVNGGQHYGLPPDHKLITQHRYSVHTSFHIDSPYSTYVRHLTFEDKSELAKIYQKTTALKSKSGFANVFSIRFGDLRLRIDSPPQGDKKYAQIDFGEIDPRYLSLIITVFVGHIDSKFESPKHDIYPPQIESEHYKIIFLYGLLTIPSIPFANIIERITNGDDIDAAGIDLKPDAFVSHTVDECLDYFQFIVAEHTNNYYKALQILSDYLDTEK